MDDLNTLLQWEKKETTDDLQNYANPHDVDNTYTWSKDFGGTLPDGTLFTDFLGKLNNCTSVALNSVSGGFAGRCDWRVPNHVELQTILNCSNFFPCIDSIFGPTQASFYWSSTTRAVFSDGAWVVGFSDGDVSFDGKFLGDFARAVRGGR